MSKVAPVLVAGGLLYFGYRYYAKPDANAPHAYKPLKPPAGKTPPKDTPSTPLQWKSIPLQYPNAIKPVRPGMGITFWDNCNCWFEDGATNWVGGKLAPQSLNAVPHSIKWGIGQAPMIYTENIPSVPQFDEKTQMCTFYAFDGMQDEKDANYYYYALPGRYHPGQCGNYGAAQCNPQCGHQS